MNSQTVGCGRIPLLLRRGGCGVNKKLRSHRSCRRRGGRSQTMVQNAFRNMVCKRPPLLKRRGMRPAEEFGNSFTRSQPWINVVLPELCTQIPLWQGADG